MAETQRDPLALAWAAGFYDGEGSCSSYLPKRRKSYRRQMAVSQGGEEVLPPTVLTRFRRILGGHGNITGPYRGYLYYWKTTRAGLIDEIAASLWPFLCDEKRTQYTEATRLVRRVAPLVTPFGGSGDVALAWAAGFFDGEGTVSISARKGGRPAYRSISMEIPQSSANGTPEALDRFRSIVGRGSVTGPHEPRSPWSKLPSYRWEAGGHFNVEAVAAQIWPWLGAERRNRIDWALGRVHEGLLRPPHPRIA